MASFRSIFAFATLAACLALQPISAYATLNVRLPQPRTMVDRVADAMSDGSLDASDLVGEAFTEFWNAVGNEIARVNICQEANGRVRDANGATTFTINVIVSGGGREASYPQQVRAVPHGNMIVIAILRPDGSYAKTFSCGRAWGMAQVIEEVDESDNVSSGGANRYTFNTDHGQVTVYLPADMRAGDTISGTVFAEPAGDNEVERVLNADRLSGYAVEVGGERTRIGEGFFRAVLGASADEQGLSIVLSGGGRAVGALAAVASVQEPQVLPFVADRAAQAGRPTQVQGEFDGDLTNTAVSIGGQDCPILAESPRQSVLRAPAAPTGPAPIVVREAGQPPYQATINNLGIALDTPRTTLARGEQTFVILTVAGVHGLQQPIEVALWASPSVSLQGGNQQAISINPVAADAAGNFQQQFDLRVLEVGPFDITAMLTDPICIIPIESAAVQRYRQALRNVRAAAERTRAAFAASQRARSALEAVEGDYGNAHLNYLVAANANRDNPSAENRAAVQRAEAAREEQWRRLVAARQAANEADERYREAMRANEEASREFREAISGASAEEREYVDADERARQQRCAGAGR